VETSSAHEAVLSVEDLSISYETRRGDVRAVQSLSFDIAKGEAYGLVGESGCGKTTAALAIMGYWDENGRVDDGRILFLGEDLLKKSPKELQKIRGNRLAMVYQDPMSTLNPSFTVGNQLTEVLRQHKGLSRQEAYRHCVETLEKVQMPDPEQVMNRYPHQISGGQQQRVVIAMALLCDPEMLIMDEPTTGLDVTVEAKVLDLIADLRKEFDTAILYISHNLSVVARVCDRIGVMYTGMMLEEASVEEAFLSPLHPYTESLLGCIPRVGASKRTSQLCPIPGRLPSSIDLPRGCVFQSRCTYTRCSDCSRFTLEGCEFSIHCAADRGWDQPPPLLEVANGRLVRCARWRHVGSSASPLASRSTPAETLCEAEGKEPILEISHLRTFYENEPSWLGSLLGKESSEVRAVDDVSLQVCDQGIVGIVGESGCGKTTLAKTVAGLIAPTEGSILFLGEDVARVVEQRPDEVLTELRMVFQNPDSTLNPTQSVRQILSRPLRISKAVSRDQVEHELLHLLDAVKLDRSYLQRHSKQMSGGEKQRISIARAVASRPELVICDEPVSSLDVSVQCSVLNTLLDIQQQYGTSLIYISHDLSMVRYMCDQIVVMYLGQVVEMGPNKALFGPPYHPYTEALLSAVPVADPSVEQKPIRLEGSVPSALNPPSGCRFHTRCPRKVGEVCETTAPPAQSVGDHAIFCHIPLEELARVKPVIVGG